MKKLIYVLFLLIIIIPSTYGEDIFIPQFLYDLFKNKIMVTKEGGETDFEEINFSFKNENDFISFSKYIKNLPLIKNKSLKMKEEILKLWKDKFTTTSFLSGKVKFKNNEIYAEIVPQHSNIQISKDTLGILPRKVIFLWNGETAQRLIYNRNGEKILDIYDKWYEISRFPQFIDFDIILEDSFLEGFRYSKLLKNEDVEIKKEKTGYLITLKLVKESFLSIIHHQINTSILALHSIEHFIKLENNEILLQTRYYRGYSKSNINTWVPRLSFHIMRLYDIKTGGTKGFIGKVVFLKWNFHPWKEEFCIPMEEGTIVRDHIINIK